MSKPTQIKPWPNQVGELSALCPLFSRRKTTESFHLDFSLIESISSSGAVILLVRLLKYLENPKHRYRITYNPLADKFFSSLGFYQLLERSKAQLIGDLFNSRQEILELSNGYRNANLLHSEIIHYIPFTEAPCRRTMAKEFLRSLSKKLDKQLGAIRYPKSGLLTILNEIAKNSADHSGADSLFGFDIFLHGDNFLKLSFTWGDLGPGLHEHFKKNLPADQKARLPYFDLTQSYRLALLGGNSSRSNAANRGLGLPTIIEGCRCIDLQLSVYDANSMAMLNRFSGLKTYSHREVRKRFLDVGHEIGFFYYGELILKRHDNQS